MAKKRKDKKFSKTKQRPKNKIRESINHIRARLGSQGLDRSRVRDYLIGFGDGLNIPPAPPPPPPGETAAQRRQRERNNADNQPPGGTRFSAMAGKADVLQYSGPDGNAAIHLNLTRSSPGGESDLNDTLRAIMEGDGNRPLPRQIAVSAKRDDADDVRKQLEQMVADMNEEARGDATKTQYRIEQVLSTNANLGNGLFAKKIVNIQYSLTPVAADQPPVLSPVMSSADLREGLGKDTKLTGSRQYTDMLDALDAYHTAMAKFADNSDTPADLLPAINAHRALLNAAQAYLAVHTTKEGGKKNAAERLIAQVNDAGPLRKFNPTDVATTTEGRLLGHGSKGEIRSRVFPDGFEAAVKPDSTETTEPAIDAGIINNNPQESRRAVAAYAVDQLLGVGAIPETRFITKTEADGTVKLGQAIRVVRGTPGQKFVRTRELPQAEVRAKIDSNEATTNDKFEAVQDAAEETGMRIYRREPRVVRVDYSNANLQKGLSNLQLLDNIIGAADRHPGNFMYETNENGDIISVKGIDNDDAHGPRWNPEIHVEDRGARELQFVKFSKTPGIPPVIDVETTIKVLQRNEEELRARLNLLPSQDAEQEVARFNTLKAALIDRIREGRLASDNGNITPQQIANLRAAGVPQNVPIPNVALRWGTPAVIDLHRVRDERVALDLHHPWNPGRIAGERRREFNSYLGTILALQAERGDTPP